MAWQFLFPNVYINASHTFVPQKKNNPAPRLEPPTFVETANFRLSHLKSYYLANLHLMNYL